MICPECNINRVSKFKNSKFCSRKCAAKNRVKDKEYLEKLSVSGKKADREPLTDLHKKNISLALQKRYESSIGEETKLKMSLSKKGKPGTSRKGIKMPESFWTDDRKRKASLNNKGGRCKWHTFTKSDGYSIKLQGSYELRFAKILDLIDPNWIKPTIHDREHQFNWHSSDGKSHWYTPDFWSPKLNRYFEIKGFWETRFEEKRIYVESLSSKITIIMKDDLEIIEKTKMIAS